MLAAAQQPGPQPPYLSPEAYALPLDRGASGLWQSLQKLKTRASLMMVVAHPDDEDGGMLAYESRGQGADTTLLTLNRGEGGQNVMTGDYWDQLGIMRTQELLAAGAYYGVHQRWTRVADYGFSKTLDEALKNWGHDRVLYDVVRQVRITRPLVITSVFAGNLSDGHGHHQTAGLMAQEAYKLAGDPNVFPDQIAAGLKPWSPLKVYARVPFARVTEKGIFDYATGKWEPVRFKNYVTGETINAVPSKTLEIPEGTYNALFARNYLAVAREGLANQKSQNDGVGMPLPGQFNSPYHLYASRVSGAALPVAEKTFFDGIDISLTGIADYAPVPDRPNWRKSFDALTVLVNDAMQRFNAADPSQSAPLLAQGLEMTRSLQNQVKNSNLSADARYDMLHELSIKEDQFNDALSQSLGVMLVATVNPVGEKPRMGPFGELRGNTPTYQVAIPGQPVSINVHVANQGAQTVTVDDVALVGDSGDWKWKTTDKTTTALTPGQAGDLTVEGSVPENAPVTKPYFSRPTLEQSYYDLNNPAYLGLPTMPYPVTARLLYSYAGVQASVLGTVQTTHRINGIGPVLEPLMIAPAISVLVSPEAGVIPSSSSSLTLKVALRSNVKGPAEGEVALNLPDGWTSSPRTAHFSTARDGDEKKLIFEVTPKNIQLKPYTITAVAKYDGKEYKEGFTTVSWPGLRPYPSYRPATYRTTGVDLKTPADLKIGYIMGTGEDVPASLSDVGVQVTQLTAADLASTDLSKFDAVVVGIRAYANRPDLRANNNRLLDYVNNGGTVVVEYQTNEYDHNYGPYAISVPSDAEKVVDENSKATILDAADPLLNWPNKITSADFDNWVEERGHGFASTWDPKFTALTEMHDDEQDPQKGGLLYARHGKGLYIYTSFAFFRQIPEGVPGSYRIYMNLISASRNPAYKPASTGVKAAPKKKR